MTRTEYIELRAKNDDLMHQSRLDERKALAAVNVRYEEKSQELKENYKRQLQALMDERTEKRLEVEREYKAIRRKLHAEDCVVVDQWRAQQMQEGGQV